MAFMIVIFLSFLSAGKINSQIHIIGICDNDKDLRFNCSTVFQSVSSFSRETFGVAFEGTVIQGSRNLIENLNALDHGIQLYGSSFIISFGSDAIVQASAITGNSFGIPVITYPTSPSSKLIYEDNIIDVRPSLTELAIEVYTLIGGSNIHMVHVICQQSLINDGFVETFSRISTESGFNESHVTAIPTIGNDVKLLRMALLKVRNSGSRIFVLHCMEEVFGSVMHMAGAVGILHAGYSWILTQTAFTVDQDTLDHIPPGVLAVKTYQNDNYYDNLKSIVGMIQQTIALIILDKKGKEAEDALQSFLRAGNFSVMKYNNSLFNEEGNRKNLKYQVLKLVTSDSNGRTWNPVSYPQGYVLDFHTMLGPVGNERGYVTVVTKEAEPFVFITGPVESRYLCPGKVACIELYTDDPKTIDYIVDIFKGGIDKMDGYYRTFCCEGVVIEMLQKISKELEFDFVVIFNNDSSYGHLVNGTWTGMVGNVVSGAADVIAGAFSITSDRMNAISFTNSFYHSGFNMISLTNGTHTSIIAFLSPFNKWEWLCIFATASITAVATALLEWNSPFGLNPWGRRRGTNYSLGSGLTMVYSIWFGNTVKIKCPKSWPSKVLQNCWACMAIFIVASYTANLAAVMAGNSNQEETYSILDSTLQDKRIAVLQNSVAEAFTNTVNSGIGVKLQTNQVNSVHEAFQKLRNGEIDLFLHDIPLLEYHMYNEDANCSFKYAGRPFGDSSYSFGVANGFWLKDKLSTLVLKYVESGLVEELKLRYLRNRRRCGNSLKSVMVLKKLDLEHTGGLFVMLLVAMGVAFLLLCFEHLIYTSLVPKLRKKPRNSFWKSIRISFISQRLYRSIVSEQFVSARQTAMEMMDMVKRRHFIRIFQKNELLGKRNETKEKRQGICDIAGNLVALQRLATKTPELTETSSNGPYKISSGDVTTGSFPTIEPNHNRELRYSTETNFNNSEPNNPLNKLGDSKCHQDDRKLGLINFVFEEDRETKTYKLGEHWYDKRLNNTRVRDSQSLDSSDFSELKYIEETRKKSQEGWVFDTWPSQLSYGSMLPPPALQRLRSFFMVDQFSNANHMLHGRNVRSMPSIFIRRTDNDDYFSRNIELKDNRVKSTIRRHAMTGFQLHSSTVFDECAVEALTKADLLMLWKRSEIELQTRLNQIEAQNRYLRHIIKICELSNRDKEYHAKQKKSSTQNLMSTRL